MKYIIIVFSFMLALVLFSNEKENLGEKKRKNDILFIDSLNNMDSRELSVLREEIKDSILKIEKEEENSNTLIQIIDLTMKVNCINLVEKQCEKKKRKSILFIDNLKKMDSRKLSALREEIKGSISKIEKEKDDPNVLRQIIDLERKINLINMEMQLRLQRKFLAIKMNGMAK